MPDLSVRSSTPEIMDDLNCSGEVLRQTLRELEFINKWLGGNAVTIHALDNVIANKTINKPLRIADLGCGSGDMLRIIQNWADRKNIPVELTGIDANPNIIEYASNNLKDLPSISLLPLDIFSNSFRALHFDIVIGTLFFHHFSAESMIQFFSNLRDQVKVGIIVNDIHRHFLAFHSIRILTAAFSRSPMVKNDAPLSVMRAFSKKDLVEILEKAGLTDYAIHWKWAFRWQVVINLDR